MYDGPVEEITLLCKNHLLGKLIDRFGTEFECIPVSDTVFKATVQASIGNTFFGWIFQYAGEMEIVEPKHVVDLYANHRKKAEQKLLPE